VYRFDRSSVEPMAIALISELRRGTAPAPKKRIQKVACTIADLSGSAKILSDHVSEAIQ